MDTPTLTAVAIEFDPAYEAGRTLFDHLALDIPAREVLRKALSESGGAGTDTDFVDLVFSPRATEVDLAFFKESPTRTHLLREAIDGECVLVGRSLASNYRVVGRQIGSGISVLVALPLEQMLLDSATRAARLNDDDVLSLLFETATRVATARHIDIGKITAYVAEMRSAAAAESDTRRSS